ncbi:MAG: DNA translocase FtsK [Synergistaceae bacterium]|jgi:S-DNA-T family DNA segregation ATPase FtsK/SpoIIIE|nr:DNA translocase FtsK [Synergistaceae bacterium]
MTAKRVSHPKTGKKGGRDIKQGKFKASSVNELTAPKTVKAKPRLDTVELRERAEFGLSALAYVMLAVGFFLISSVLTGWTGVLGRTSGGWLVRRFGISVLVILFFVVYVCLSRIFQKRLPQPLRQTAGAFLLYVSASLFLGLLDFALIGGGIYYLTPGALGRDFSRWSYENLGPLGTTLIGLSIIGLDMYFFGVTMPFDALKGALSRLKKRVVSSRPKHEYVRDTGETDGGDESEQDAEYDEYGEGDEYDPTAEDEYEEDTGTDEFGDASFSDLSRDDAEKRSDSDPFADYGTSDMENLPNPEDIEYRASTPPPGRFPPPPEIFGMEDDDEGWITEEMARPWGNRIIDSLAEFGIEAELAEILIGPTVIQFRIQPSPGVKVSRIVGLANDLTMALAVSSLRVEAPIPGKPFVGIEIPNPMRRGITLRSIIEEDEYQDTTKSLPLPMGVTINGDPLVIGLEELPHLLVAGTTGSGKSVFVNSCIIGLCSTRRPDELKMVLVDPKRVEMASYEKLPHILTPPVTDPKKAVHVLGWAIREMGQRYSRFAEGRVRNLASYNELVLPKDRLPHIVIVVDELADLMMTAAKEVEEYICRLAQMARATGIHLILATQRPSVNVITGLIKANVPARVAFTLPSMMDSRTIIDSGGAEKLLGRGDMLFLSTQNPKPVRVQSPWIDEGSITRWINYLINMFGEPIYTDIDDQGDSPAGFEEQGGFDDALLEEAVKIVTSTGVASTSGLQRRLRVGFTRAGRLIDMMEKAGIVGPADGARPREILTDEEEAEEILARLGRQNGND